MGDPKISTTNCACIYDCHGAGPADLEDLRSHAHGSRYINAERRGERT